MALGSSQRSIRVYRRLIEGPVRVTGSPGQTQSGSGMEVLAPSWIQAEAGPRSRIG